MPKSGSPTEEKLVTSALNKIKNHNRSLDGFFAINYNDVLNSRRAPGTKLRNFYKESLNYEDLSGEQKNILFYATKGLEKVPLRPAWELGIGTESLPRNNFAVIVAILFMIAAFTVGGLIRDDKIGDKRRMDMPYECASSASNVETMEKNCCRYNDGRVTDIYPGRDPFNPNQERRPAKWHCSNVWFASASFLLMGILLYLGDQSYSGELEMWACTVTGAVLFICAVGMTIPLTTKRSAEAAEYIEKQEDKSSCDISIMEGKNKYNYTTREWNDHLCKKKFCAPLYTQVNANEWKHKTADAQEN